MTQEIQVAKGFNWQKFLRKHWNVVTIFVAAAILAVIGVIVVFLWFVGNAQSTALVPSTLGLWTMANLVSFILHLIFWELIFIGIPAAIAAVIGWEWWRRRPYDEKSEFNFGKRSRASRGGSGVSLLLFIAFAIKVYIDGNWNVAISTWKLDYVVNSVITILIWLAAIIGIPLLIALGWWIHRELTRA